MATPSRSSKLAMALICAAMALICALVAIALVAVRVTNGRGPIRGIVACRRATAPSSLATVIAREVEVEEGVVDEEDEDGDRNHHRASEVRPNSPRTWDRRRAIDDLPIYVVRPSLDRSSVSSWRDVASTWNRNATFDDMLAEISRRRRGGDGDGESSSLPGVPSNDRVVIILHTAPKMGSLTLRLACRRNLVDGCGRVSSKNRREPDGYRGGAELADVIRKCDTIHHFCINGEMFPTEVEIGRFANASFFHLYPFRNYDDWAISALKQIYDRGGAEQCEKEGASMDDACTDRRPELSFSKYTKARMSIAVPRVARRVDDMEESHHVVLYPYAEIDALLALFHEAYAVPLLSGSAEMHHAKRPEGTCDGSILDKFHECFAHRLDELS